MYIHSVLNLYGKNIVEFLVPTIVVFFFQTSLVAWQMLKKYGFLKSVFPGREKNAVRVNIHMFVYIYIVYIYI